MQTKLTLLMIVTPPEKLIARYTMSALSKFIDVDGLKIVVYANGFSERDEEKLCSWIPSHAKNIQFVSNRSRLEIQKELMVPGESYVTDAGRKELRVGLYESAPEVWERELLKFDSELVGILDGDFEVINSTFLKDMLSAFSSDQRLGFMSVDYSPTMRVYDSYSNQDCVLIERYHTWFCIYRSEALRLCSDFSFFEEIRNGLITKYDHSALLQETLAKKYGYHGAVIDSRYSEHFIHYGAFAQNRSLDGFQLYFYRICRIGCHNGWTHLHRMKILEVPIKMFFKGLFKLFMLHRFDRERSKYIFEK